MSKKHQIILATITIGFWLMLVIGALFANYGQVIEKWQTLIGGFLALVAAILTAVLLNRQITQSEKQEIDRLNSRFEAVRATLPLVLSGLCKYAMDNVQALSPLLDRLSDDNDHPGEPEIEIVQAPVELIQNLKEMIEAARDSSVRSRLADIIGEIQIFNARLNGFVLDLKNPNVSGKRNTTIHHIIQAAAIYAASSSLFDYSRRKSESIQDLNWDSVTNVYMSLDIIGPRYGDVFARVREMRNYSTSPFAMHDD